MLQKTSDEPSRVVDGTGLSATFGKMEAEKIHQENEERLAKMSSDEIIAEQQKLLETLGNFLQVNELILSQRSPGFYASSVQSFIKHCGKRRNCS